MLSKPSQTVARPIPASLQTLDFADTAADPRVKRTRQLIVRAFAELMAEKGFQEITVQDIAERATINRATFYAHFLDKHALLNHIIGESYRQMLGGRLLVEAAITAGNMRILVHATFEHLAQFLPRTPSIACKQMEPLVEAQVQHLLYLFLMEWFAQHKDRLPYTSAQKEAVATTLSWAIFGAASQWSHSDRQRPMEDDVEQVLGVLLGSFGHAISAPAIS